MRRSQHWVTLGLLGIVGWFASASPGAEIRNRVGERDIVRTTALQATRSDAGASDSGSAGSARNGASDASDDDAQPETIPVPLGSPMGPSLVEPELHDAHGMHGMPMDIFDGGCPGCGDMGCSMDCVVPLDRWVKVEYLLWWRKGRSIPPLAITSTDDLDINNLVLGVDTTEILFGGSTIGEDSRPGGRLTLGTWLDESEHHGIEARYWQLGNEEIRFNAASDGDVPLARPFTDTLVNPAVADSRTLAFPGFNSDGRISISSTSEVYGGDVTYRRMIGCGMNNRLYLLGGYQYSRIDEDLIISDSTFIEDIGTTQAITDHFATQNRYNAGAIGLAYEYFGDCWHMDILAKVAFGNMNQRVAIQGTTVNTVNGQSTELPFGLLAIDNQGTFSRDTFAVSPELGINFAWQVTEAIDLSVGYSYVYWNTVAQPEDQIPVGPAGPLVPSDFVLREGSYWVHGLNFGGEVRF